jgi:hypothetical protein
VDGAGRRHGGGGRDDVERFRTDPGGAVDRVPAGRTQDHGLAHGQHGRKDDFARSATFVSQLAYMPWDGFGPGTEAGAPTKAKPEIWKETDKFTDLQKKLQGETAKLAQVAAGGNMDQIKAQFAETGKACSNCHDSFRAK